MNTFESEILDSLRKGLSIEDIQSKLQDYVTNAQTAYDKEQLIRRAEEEKRAKQKQVNTDLDNALLTYIKKTFTDPKYTAAIGELFTEDMLDEIRNQFYEYTFDTLDSYVNMQKHTKSKPKVKVEKTPDGAVKTTVSASFDDDIDTKAIQNFLTSLFL